MTTVMVTHDLGWEEEITACIWARANWAQQGEMNTNLGQVQRPCSIGRGVCTTVVGYRRSLQVFEQGGNL